MDSLLAAALEEVALEGRQGCSVAVLWVALTERLPTLGSVDVLSPGLKRYLWGSLVNRPADLQLLRNGPSNAVDAEAAPVAVVKKRGKNVEVLPETHQVARSDPSYTSWLAAETSGVILQGSEALRASVLGLYDCKEHRSPISVVQLSVLERVAQARRKGAIQSDLALLMKVAHANFYYIVKCLEQRGLIVRNPVFIMNPGAGAGSDKAGSFVSNLLHIKRFAPDTKLAPMQMFKLVRNSNGTTGYDVGCYSLQDDSNYLALICETIAATAERVVVEFELKQLLGFTMTKGHRAWRKFKVRANREPCAGTLIEWLAGEGPRTVRSPEHRLRPPRAAAAGGREGKGTTRRAGERRGGEEGAAGGASPGSVSECIVELSVERQLLQSIAAAGPGGHPQHRAVCGDEDERQGECLQVGVGGCVRQPGLADVVKKFGIQVLMVSIGKTLYNRLIAPQAAIVALQALNTGQLPQLCAPVHDADASAGAPAAAAPAAAGRTGAQPPVSHSATPAPAAQLAVAVRTDLTAAAVGSRPAAGPGPYTASRPAGSEKASGARAAASPTQTAAAKAAEAAAPDEEAAATLAALTSILNDAGQERAKALAAGRESAPTGKKGKGRPPPITPHVLPAGGAAVADEPGSSPAGPAVIASASASAHAPAEQAVALDPVASGSVPDASTLVGQAVASAAMDVDPVSAGGAAVAVAPAGAGSGEGPGAEPEVEGDAMVDAADAAPKLKGNGYNARGLSGLQEDRARRLLNHLNDSRFIMRAEIRSILFAGEAAAMAAAARVDARGGSSGAVAPDADADPELVQMLRGGKKGMDSKAVVRLMNMLIDSGKAKKCLCERSYRTARPGHQPSATANMMEVLVRADVVIDQELLVEMVEMGYIVNAKLRNLGMTKLSADREGAVAASLASVTQVAQLSLVQPLLLTTALMPGESCAGNRKVGEVSAQALTHDNGYIVARMIRARMLHYQICKLVGLAGFQAEWTGRGTPNPDSFSAEEVFKAMPFALALQIIGCPKLVPADQLAELFGEKPISKLHYVMDILRRMHLLGRTRPLTQGDRTKSQAMVMAGAPWYAAKTGLPTPASKVSRRPRPRYSDARVQGLPTPPTPHLRTHAGYTDTRTATGPTQEAAGVVPDRVSAIPHTWSHGLAHTTFEVPAVAAGFQRATHALSTPAELEHYWAVLEKVSNEHLQAKATLPFPLSSESGAGGGDRPGPAFSHDELMKAGHPLRTLTALMRGQTPPAATNETVGVHAWNTQRLVLPLTTWLLLAGEMRSVPVDVDYGALKAISERLAAPLDLVQLLVHQRRVKGQASGGV
ncbi:MAG: hypothetical protein WDW36_002555 [Sanguina aurantia]